ncbi:MAG: phosphonopyruvate decarboxylase [Candidatus Heimdallarchaeaceae archaeon]
MIRCSDFYDLCKKYNFTFFSGVPDSTFKSWMSFLDKNKDKITNVPTVNECEAVAVCSGYHLATGNIGVLYMQNSGFGKTVNPLTSLCDPKVYSIPILLMIGWRGEPGKKDAPQHHKMGPMTIPLLETLEIPYEIISGDIRELDNAFEKAKRIMEKENRPFAFVVKKGIFEKLEDAKDANNKPSREEAIKAILETLDGNEIIVSTTGKTSREVFENRINKEDCSKDFYNIGAMGCTQSIALGIALNKKDKKVFVFDGDGSVLMQMGALATIGSESPENLYHIIFDNNAHDSTGGQPTHSDSVEFDKIALACRYKSVKIVEDLSSLKEEVRRIKQKPGPSMIVVKVKKGSRKDLGRPTLLPIEHKNKFMKYLREE